MEQKSLAERERTIRWANPECFAVALEAMSGLDFLRAALEGKLPLPPSAKLLGFAFTEVEEGRVVGTFTPQESLYNPLGTVHGGLITTALDTVMGCAVHSRLSAGRAYTTLELKVNFLRPVTAHSGPLRSVGQVVHFGRSTALAEAKLVDDKERLYAHATSTCLLLNA